MGLPVAWSPEAVEDLESIAEYIGRDSVHYAGAVASKLLDVSRNLSTAPKIGRMVPELNRPEIRERLVYSYRLVYRVEEDGILVIAIIHGKQQFESFTNRFE